MKTRVEAVPGIAGILLRFAVPGIALGAASKEPAASGLGIVPPTSGCHPLPGAVLTPDTLRLGQPTFILTALNLAGSSSGCMGHPTYTYAGLPLGCPNCGLPSCLGHPLVPGNYTVQVHVYFANGLGNAGAALEVTP